MLTINMKSLVFFSQALVVKFTNIVYELIYLIPLILLCSFLCLNFLSDTVIGNKTLLTCFPSKTKGHLLSEVMDLMSTLLAMYETALLTA